MYSNIKQLDSDTRKRIIHICTGTCCSSCIGLGELEGDGEGSGLVAERHLAERVLGSGLEQLRMQLPGSQWAGGAANKIYSWISHALWTPSRRVVKVQRCVHSFLLVGRDSGSWSTALIIEYVFVTGRQP